MSSASWTRDGGTQGLEDASTWCSTQTQTSLDYNMCMKAYGWSHTGN